MALLPNPSDSVTDHGKPEGNCYSYQDREHIKKQVTIQGEGAIMKYRKVMQLSMAMTMLTSGSIPAQAVFPETEFSKGAPE
ncbi:MAG: hypothetical protein AAB314_03335, partial [Nitrospirota bacterium]